MSPWLIWLLFGLVDHLWVRIEFAGDLALGREIPKRIESIGADRYFSSLREHLRTADLAVANLEGSVKTGVGTSSVAMRYDLSFDADALGGLTRSGFSAFGLANNHARDGGPGSLERTIAELSAIGLTGFVGRRAFLIKGVSIVIHAADLTASPPGGRRYRDLVNQVASDSRKNLTFVFPHVGTEDTDHVPPAERSFAKALVDAGAAGVFGHHPHRIKSGGSITGRPVYHSLGSVVFDRSRKPDCFGLLVRIHLWAGMPIGWERFFLRMMPATHQPIVLGPARKGEELPSPGPRREDNILYY